MVNRVAVYDDNKVNRVLSGRGMWHRNRSRAAMPMDDSMAIILQGVDKCVRHYIL